MSCVRNYKSKVCFMPACKTGYSSDRKLRKERGENNPRLFHAPKDPVTFEKWQEIIPRSDKVFSVKDVVCALHFPEEDILHFYENKLSDGTISRIQREKPILKNGSLPTLFLNEPHLSDKNKRRKPACERIKAPNTKKKYIHHQLDNLNSAELEEIPDIKPLVDNGIDAEFALFENLKNSLDIIGTPNMQWTGIFIPEKNEVLFAEWDDDDNTPKKIVIRQDMSFKVLFGEIEIKLDGGHQIFSDFDDIENILIFINKMKI